METGILIELSSCEQLSNVLVELLLLGIIRLFSAYAFCLVISFAIVTSMTEPV